MWRGWWLGVGGETTLVLFADRRHRGADRLLRPCALVILISLISAAAEAHAFGLVVSRSPEETALGMDRPVFSLAFETASSGTRASSWSVEAGEWRLFDATGLFATVCGAEARRGDWGCGVSAAVVSSPIGKEAVLTGAILAPGSGRIRLAGGVRLNTVAFEGFEHAYLLCISLHALLRLSPHVALCPGVNNIRVRGERLSGADASLHVVAFPDLALCGVAEIGVSRNGGVTLGVSSRLRMARGVFFAVGYEEGTGALNGSMSFRFRSMGLDVGASVHPVLGVSEALFVSWRKGR